MIIKIELSFWFGWALFLLLLGLADISMTLFFTSVNIYIRILGVFIGGISISMGMSEMSKEIEVLK